MGLRAGSGHGCTERRGGQDRRREEQADQGARDAAAHRALATGDIADFLRVHVPVGVTMHR
jgi:hypothetical protein